MFMLHMPFQFNGTNQFIFILQKSFKGADYLEIRDQLKEAQEVIRRLQEENENLREQIVEYKKTEGTLEQNASSLLITARAELKRKEQEIRDLRKE